MAKIVRTIALLVLLVASPLYAADNPYALPLSTVIIDAGHGGHDPGAVRFFEGSLIVERDLTLDIALRLERLLQEAHPSLHVVLTRRDDRFLPLEERGRIAYQTILPPKTSALFLSIHINSAEHPAARGFEVFTKLREKEVPLLDSTTPKEHIPLFSKHDRKELNVLLFEETRRVADVVLAALAEGLPAQTNRGVKELDLWVLNAARMPAVLVEAGFLSNDEELALLLDPQYRQRIARALLQAIGELLPR